MNVEFLKTQKRGILDRAKAIAEKAEAEKRELTVAERASFDTLMGEAKLISDQLNSAPTARPDVRGTGAAPILEWRDKDGNPIRVLRKENRMADLHASSERKGDIGRLIVGMATGNWTGAEDERRAMAEGVNSLGGVTVPAELSASVIDLARARAVCMQGGAVTIPMTSDKLTIARITADATMQVKEENAAFTEYDMAFDGVLFSAKTLGTVVTMSRELMMDSPNAGDAIRNALSTALAVKLDEVGLIGGLGITGLINTVGIGEIASVGQPAWQDLVNAIRDVELQNGVPTGYVLNPTTKADLIKLATGDGTNSPAGWLTAPEGVRTLQQLATTAMPNTTAVVGDFTQMAFGLRQTAEVQLSDVAGEAFARNQIKIRVVWRGDVGLLRPAHFVKLTGITTGGLP